MKLSLIQIVQDTLASMDSDSVNSIGDTYEATQVASIVRTCFNNIVSRADLPVTNQLFSLTPSTNPAQPTVMYRPPNVVNVNWIQYNTQLSTAIVPNWTQVSFLEVGDFMNLVLGYASQVNSNVISTNSMDSFNTNSNLGPPYSTQTVPSPPWSVASTSTVTVGPAPQVVTFTIPSNTNIAAGDVVTISVNPVPQIAVGNVVSYTPSGVTATLVVDIVTNTAVTTSSTWVINGMASLQQEEMNNAISYTITNSSGDVITLYALTYVGPTYWTSFDEQTVLFDSFDASIDSTIQANKLICYGGTVQTFQMLDTWVPPLEDHQFAVLLNEVKLTAHAELKQSVNAVATAEARKQWIHLNKTKRTLPTHVPEIFKLPNYGRMGGRNSDLAVSNIINAMKRGN